MTPRFFLLTALGAGAACGCTAPVGEPIPERLGLARASLTVEEAVTAGCSTAQIEALSRQIICQSNVNEPGAFSELSPAANVNFGGAVLPFLEEPARDRLAEALDENPSLDMQINSMLRTVAQQYLLYRWYLTGACGIALAASPSNSNHETGLAIDVQQYDAWRTILEAKDFAWLGASDPVHFDYVGAGAVDHRDLGVLAFQQLWNLNNAGDIIDEDGIYGPQTEARLQLAPAEGFPTGPSCGSPGDGDLSISASFAEAEDRFDDGPSAGVTDLFEGESYELTLTVSNTGTAPVDEVALALDADDVLSLSETSLDLGTIGAGESVMASLTVTAESYSIAGDEPAAISVTASDASAEVTVDVYSQLRWEWDGGRLEGWSAIAGGDLTIASGALSIAAGNSAVSPTIAVPASGIRAVQAIGTADEPATLIVNTTEGEHLFNLALSPEPNFVSLDGVSGDITGLRIDATSTITLDSLRLEADAINPVAPDDDGGCGCSLPGRSSKSPAWVLLLALGALCGPARRLKGWGSRPSPSGDDRRRRRSP